LRDYRSFRLPVDLVINRDCNYLVGQIVKKVRMFQQSSHSFLHERRGSLKHLLRWKLNPSLHRGNSVPESWCENEWTWEGLGEFRSDMHYIIIIIKVMKYGGTAVLRYVLKSHTTFFLIAVYRMVYISVLRRVRNNITTVRCRFIRSTGTKSVPILVHNRTSTLGYLVYITVRIKSSETTIFLTV